MVPIFNHCAEPRTPFENRIFKLKMLFSGFPFRRKLPVNLSGLDPTLSPSEGIGTLFDSSGSSTLFESINPNFRRVQLIKKTVDED